MLRFLGTVSKGARTSDPVRVIVGSPDSLKLLHNKYFGDLDNTCQPRHIVCLLDALLEYVAFAWSRASGARAAHYKFGV